MVTQEYYQTTIESEIGEKQMLQLTLIMRNKDTAKSYYQGWQIISKTFATFYNMEQYGKYKNGTKGKNGK